MGKEIIIVTIALGNDGAERVLTNLANQWIKQGHKVTVIQTGAENYGCSYALSDQAEMINIYAKNRFKPLRYLEEVYSLVKILRQRPNATVVSFIVSSIFILAVSSFFVKNKIVVSERNNPKECPAGKLQQKLRDWAFCQADVCVYQTHEAMEMFPEKAQKKGIVIPNPINTNLPGKVEQYQRNKTILTACRLHPQKNLPMLIEAFHRLSAEHPEYSLVIYGQGSERESLERMIAERGLTDRILMPGFSSDIHEKMRDAAMFVSSSDYEGISNSMLEALAMGIPTVVTDCPVGGARLMIQDGVNGVLVPVGDADAMYQGMKKVIEDADFAERIAVEAYKVRERYPIEKVSEMWIDLM